jgi:hypothetical protein
MWELALHYERMRRAYPDHELCIVFDIDGTILDARYLVAHALLAYDQQHATGYFHGLRSEDVTVHENRIDRFLEDLALPAPVRADVLAWYAKHLWSPEAILAANQPYQGVLGVIRWFQLQPATCTALNTGRPEEIRDLTLQSLNALGKASRVMFRSDLLWMNPYGWGQRVADSKVACIRWLQERGLRVVAAVDNEPAIIQAMAAADQTHEILFLHADTIFESQRVVTPRTVRGTTYDLAGLVSEEELRRRVQFVWHGVNDEANLRQFLASGVGWAECDIRRDPLDRLVLRHDSFEETPWHRAEHPFRLEACLQALGEQDRSVALDLKEGGEVIDRVLGVVAAMGIDDGRLWFNGSIEVLCEGGIRRLAESHPGATLLSIDLVVECLAMGQRLVPSLHGVVPGQLPPLRHGSPPPLARSTRTSPRTTAADVSMPSGRASRRDRLAGPIDRLATTPPSAYDPARGPSARWRRVDPP